MSDVTVLNVPGLGGSGSQHWQTLWEARDPSFRRVEQRDWNDPFLDEWLEVLEDAVARAPSPVVLVAHSLGVALVNHWAGQTRGRVRGALLVAPADVDSKKHPPEAQRFGPMPLNPLPFMSIVVASENDPYASLRRARYFADCWGSRFVDVEALGHINADSRLGTWDTGFALLNELLQDTAAQLNTR